MRREYIAWFDMPNSGKLHGQSVMPKQELTRCKDCKHWQKSRINYNEYVCYWGGYVKQEDDFCSWAVRKGKRQ